MLKFNNDNIFTGYVKQLLSSFDLPSYRIYTTENRKYKEKHGEESPEILPSYLDGSAYRSLYIKGDGIMAYKDPNWVKAGNYYPGKKTPNTTHRFKIKNNIYDSYTHEYLGEYLRFLRDYYDYDLMPLYNCFSNRVCQTLLIELGKAGGDSNASYSARFNATDGNYKIYMLPAKLFKEYTIAIDCGTSVEICCGLFGKYQDETSAAATALPEATYKKYGRMAFNQPVLYAKLKDIYKKLSRTQLQAIAEREQDLKLFIKLPSHNSSSITVLEGDYLGYNDRLTTHAERNTYSWSSRDGAGKTVSASTHSLHEVKNHIVTNFLDESKTDGSFVSDEEFRERGWKPITYLTLLGYNTGVSYPFADKLIEYLSGNVISPLDDIPDNIERAQTAIEEATDGRISGYAGLWDERMRPVLYDFMQKYYGKTGVTQDMNRDVLGYVDKTLESRYSAIKKTKKGYKRTSDTIANVDLYPDIFKASKED